MITIISVLRIRIFFTGLQNDSRAWTGDSDFVVPYIIYQQVMLERHTRCSVSHHHGNNVPSLWSSGTPAVSVNQRGDIAWGVGGGLMWREPLSCREQSKSSFK